MRKQNRPLNNNHLRFVAEYFADSPRNATAAYERAYPGVTHAAAQVNSSHLMADPRVIAEIDKREQQLRDDLKMTAQDIVRELYLVASADPRDLCEYYVGSCRHCWGHEHRYQRTPAEYEQAVKDYAVACRKNKIEDPLLLNFDHAGGVGFNQRREPNPNCPECFGDGVGYEVFKDTRDLSPAAARLYQGVKRTRDGLEIKVRSQDRALELAGQHLGLFKQGVELSGPNGGPIAVAAKSISTVTTDPIEASRLYQNIIGS